jgi:hypothetical protein
MAKTPKSRLRPDRRREDGPGLTASAEEMPDGVRINLDGEDGNLLTRRQGEALAALQHIVSAVYRTRRPRASGWWWTAWAIARARTPSCGRWRCSWREGQDHRALPRSGTAQSLRAADRASGGLRDLWGVVREHRRRLREDRHHLGAVAPLPSRQGGDVLHGRHHRRHRHAARARRSWRRPAERAPRCGLPSSPDGRDAPFTPPRHLRAPAPRRFARSRRRGRGHHLPGAAVLHRRGRRRDFGARQPGGAGAIVAAAVALGARLAEPGEFTLRASCTASATWCRRRRWPISSRR